MQSFSSSEMTKRKVDRAERIARKLVQVIYENRLDGIWVTAICSFPVDWRWLKVEADNMRNTVVDELAAALRRKGVR